MPFTKREPMRTDANKHRGTAKIPRLVWTLAGIGIGAGILAMAIQFRALSTIDREFEWTKVTDERAAKSFQLLRQARAAAFSDMESHLLDLTGATAHTELRHPGSVDPFVLKCLEELAGREGDQANQAETTAALRNAFASLSQIHQELERYHADNQNSRDQLRGVWVDLKAKLVKAREATDKIVGRRRLQHQLVLRRYRKAVQEDTVEIASMYIDGMESVNDLRIFSSELGELTLLSERLYGESRVDQLINLKDNEIRQTLMRLYLAAGRVDHESRDILAAHTTSLRDAMFGEGAVDDEAYQTLVVGDGGLFQVKLQSLMLDADRRRLRTSLSMRLNECMDAERSFDLALSAAADANARRAELVFRAAWRDALATGIIVSIVFLALSWRLARLGRIAEDELHTKNESLKRAMDELEIVATTDKLTGLPNRAVILDRLDMAMKRSHRDGSRFAVLFFDFDRFKNVNDSLGHDVGDALLCDIARIMQGKLRETDTLARIGGDEFVVLLGDLKCWSDAEVVATDLLRSLAVPHQLDDHLIVSTASIGLVTNERAYESPGDMIRDADVAMYQAKASGKARVVIFDHAMHENALERLSLEADLQVAVTAGDQLRLMYQPIVDLSTGRVAGFEALLRWDHPLYGEIGPPAFIPIAEETGLINQIGKWVLRSSASQIADWNQRLPLDRTLTVNANVSKRQLMAPSFFEDVIDCQREYGLRHGELKLEITESIVADDRGNVIPLLRKLREHGFPIVMDDFGTGVSSLSVLHEYPIDVIKIDQAFIHVLNQNRSLLAVVMSITNLADNLGIKSVAEGIDTEDIVGSLQSIGCTWGQGYHFAKPLSSSDAEAYLLEQERLRGPQAA
jgi:diguanylate cyclase (GGDEF)-like protein